MLCMGSSLVASPSYSVPVALALVFALVHFISTAAFLRRTHSRAKWFLCILSAPVAVFTFDDVGRLFGLLGLPSFRILI